MGEDEERKRKEQPDHKGVVGLRECLNENDNVKVTLSNDDGVTKIKIEDEKTSTDNTDMEKILANKEVISVNNLKNITELIKMKISEKSRKHSSEERSKIT